MRTEMDEIEKLRRLLDHWMKHNDEHAEIYREWAEKISSVDRGLSEILSKLYQETKRLKGLFEEAIDKIAKP